MKKRKKKNPYLKRSPAKDWAMARNFYLFRLRGLPSGMFPPSVIHDDEITSLATQASRLVQKIIDIVELRHSSYKSLN